MVSFLAFFEVNARNETTGNARCLSAGSPLTQGDYRASCTSYQPVDFISKTNKAAIDKANAAITQGDNKGFLAHCAGDNEWLVVSELAQQGSSSAVDGNGLRRGFSIQSRALDC